MWWAEILIQIQIKYSEKAVGEVVCNEPNWMYESSLLVTNPPALVQNASENEWY